MVFTVDTDQGVTGLVLTGRGEMRFEPAPETEKGQVRIFAGDTKIETRFDAAFVRVGDLSLHANPDELVAVPVDPRELRRADEIFRVESGKSYALELGDLTAETWSLAPAPAISSPKSRTSRFDTLTYVRSRNEPEDISLFNRRRGRNISVYASLEKLATRGRFYNEDELGRLRRPRVRHRRRPPRRRRIGSGSRAGPRCGFGCCRPRSRRSRCGSPIR